MISIACFATLGVSDRNITRLSFMGNSAATQHRRMWQTSHAQWRRNRPATLARKRSTV